MQKKFLMLAWLLALCACRHIATQMKDHPIIIDSLLVKADARMETDSVAAIFHDIDVFYHKMDGAGIGDLYRKYDFKRNYYHEKGEYQLAMVYVDSALGLLQNKKLQRQYYREYVNINLHKGDILLAQKQYNNAYQYYYASKVAMEETSDSCFYRIATSNFSGRLGTVSYRQAKYREALGWYKESAESADLCKENFELFAAHQGTLDNIALCYTRLRMPDSALYYYHKTLAFITSREAQYPNKSQYVAMARAVVYGNEGDAWLQKGDTVKAIDLYRQNIAINSQKGYYNGDAHITRLKLAGVLLALNRLKEMDVVLREVEAHPEQLPYEETYVLLLKMRLLYHNQQGNPKQSRFYFDRYLLAKDSIDMSKRELAGADFNREFQNLKTEYQLHFLAEKERRSTIFLLLTIVVTCTLAAVSLLIYYNLRQSKKNGLRINLQNEQLEATLEALANSNSNYKRVMKVMAHDLKNPLGGISGICNFLLARSVLEPREQEMIALMRDSSVHALEIIEDLLDANIQKGREQSENAIDLGLLISQCVDLLRFKAKNKQQQIILKVLPGTIVKADYDKIWRIVNNLIVNAIKFSPSGERIYVALDVFPDHVQVCVQDNGMGIPEEMREKIFEGAAGREGTSGEQTYGLGLSINKELVEVYGGEIWFEAVVTGGSAFYFTLPL
ncbi:sensor histidine kinase [Filimonas effusa]|uniref:histidine kinase n=1 Tax=Filimonas effusa TaxID=2508721 RepID=A0A4Q1D3J2_9BACT|nr:HAMP domain-containing sensor histidine kinase [Filimonas effusa]RXK82992.1 HAMP domain-containing histidine kinase [Filimonas effusa]